MSTQPGPGGQPLPSLAAQYPLGAADPVKVGDFWLDARLTSSTAGTAFSAHEDGGETVMLLLLSQGAASDPAARSRFSGEINAMHIDTVVARGGEGQDEGRMAVRFRDENDDPTVAGHSPLAPWVALAWDGTTRAVTEADRVLHAVDLERTAPLGRPAGPDYRLHWSGQTAHGTTRLWPLPWPGRSDRAGWISLLTSWLLMLLLSAVAILLAILVFQNQPLVSPPPPIPTQGEGSGSGSPTDASATPDESGGSEPTRSDTPTMVEPTGEESEAGDPTPNRKL